MISPFPSQASPVARSEQSAPAPWRFSERGIAIRLFLTCWLVYALHFATNTVREIHPALSLGDHLSFDVSQYVGLHPDIFEAPGRGAFINNNPGASILGAIPYALARPVLDRIVEHERRARAASPRAAPREYATIYPMVQEFYRKARERGLDVIFGLAAGVMQAFCMAPLSASSAVVMFFILARLTSSLRAALLLALLYAFATPVFYRTAQLNQNLLVGHCAFFALVLLWRPWDDPARPRRLRYLAVFSHCGYHGMDWPRLVLLWATAFSLRFRLFTSAPLLLLALWLTTLGRMGYFSGGVSAMPLLALAGAILWALWSLGVAKEAA